MIIVRSKGRRESLTAVIILLVQLARIILGARSRWIESKG